MHDNTIGSTVKQEKLTKNNVAKSSFCQKTAAKVVAAILLCQVFLFYLPSSKFNIAKSFPFIAHTIHTTGYTFHISALHTYQQYQMTTGPAPHLWWHRTCCQSGSFGEAGQVRCGCSLCHRREFSMRTVLFGRF